MEEKYDCCRHAKSQSYLKLIPDTSKSYVCHCNHVSEADIKQAILAGASTVKQVIKATDAMTNSNCPVNNPKGVCCYPYIVTVCKKYL